MTNDGNSEVVEGSEKDTSHTRYLQKKAELVEFLKSKCPRREPDRVRVVTSLDRMIHQSNYTKPLRYYYTSGRKIRCPRVVEKETPPYFIDAQRRSNEKVHLDYINKLPNYLKPSQRDKAVIGLNDRLYIPQTDPEYPLPRTITRKAPDYYKIILGRPIEESLFNKQEHVDRLKKTFHTRLRHAVSEEVLYMNEEKKLRELCYLIYIRNEYARTIKLFNKFLADNLDELLSVSDIADKMAKLVEIKATQIELAMGTVGNIKDCLFQMDNILCYRRICKITMDDFPETKRIESRLAPEYWKREYAKEKAKLKPIADKAADYVLQMYAYFNLENPYPEEPLDQLILRLANTIRNLGPPAMYFKKPLELEAALKKLELTTVMAIQTLNVAIERREEALEKDKELEREERKSLNTLRAEIDLIQNEFVKRLSPIITVEEETGVIMSYWRAVATNPDLLQAFVHIKCLYEEFIGDEAPTKDVLEMITFLTKKIIDVQLKVLSLPKEETEKIYNDLRSKDDLKMSNALAAKKLKIETGRMLNKMKRFFENRFSHPGLPHCFEILQKHKLEETFEVPRPITPPNKRVLKNIMKIFQPTLSQEAYLNLMDSVKNLESIKKEMEVIKYPIPFPDIKKPYIKKPDLAEPAISSDLSLAIDVSQVNLSESFGSEYRERMEACTAEFPLSD